MRQEETDEKYMRRYPQLARNRQLPAKPNPMVDAVTVSKKGRIIGEGCHVRCGKGYAEVNALASVSKENEALLREAMVYVSLEPCSHYEKTPPCADLIISKGVRRAVCDCIDLSAEVQGHGVKKIHEAGIEVTVGVLERECLELNERFITYNTHKRPYVILEWVEANSPSPLPLPQREGSDHRDSPNNLEKIVANITIENRNNRIYCNYKPSVVYIGNLPGKDYQPSIISTPFTKTLVHKMRTENNTVLVRETAEELEQPQLMVREWSGPNPEKLVLTSQPTKVGEYATPAEVLSHLYAEKQQSLIVEGGAKTLQSFLDAGLWDEIRIESAPFTANKGIEAPELLDNLRAIRVEKYVNTIVIYERAQDEMTPIRYNKMAKNNLSS